MGYHACFGGILFGRRKGGRNFELRSRFKLFGPAEKTAVRFTSNAWIFLGYLRSRCLFESVKTHKAADK